MTELFYENLFSTKTKSKRADEKKEILENLYRIPQKDKGVNIPKTNNVFAPNNVHQADLLSLPTDPDGSKYALVITDVFNRITDAEPMKSKDSAAVIKAMNAIYSRDILDWPKELQTDPGPEFKNAQFAKLLKDHNVDHRIGKVGRHRQQAVVERRNGIIGKALFKRMSAQELLTGETSTEWVEDLPVLIKAMNKHTKATFKRPKSVHHVVCKGDACTLLEVGTKVRAILDIPQDVASGKRLHGTFRATDIRWDPKIRTIKKIIMRPDSPPLYLLDGDKGPDKVDPTAYTKAQLQVVPEDEKYPSKDLIRNEADKTQFRVEKIVGRKKIRGKWFYLIKWAGYSDDENTYEPESTLKSQVPELINDYDKQFPKDTVHRGRKSGLGRQALPLRLFV
jgi:hypothetical protein